LPILTFINKFDSPARDPLELLDDLERNLGIAAAPVNWPIGSAERFRGVYDLKQQTLLRYEREAQGQFRAPVEMASLDAPEALELIGEDLYPHFRESVDFIRGAGTPYDVAEYRAGRQTPVFFGSALTNFGLEPFLDALLELAPSPQPRLADVGVIEPTDEQFTAFVFKIQANMDPRHRDRVAFVRVCSGRFTKDMTLTNTRLGKPLRASRAYRFFGRERETINVAYAGDIVGLANPGAFAIGDTLHTGPAVRYPALPRFAAAHFGRVRLLDQRVKQFDDGLQQLEEEGLMQVCYVSQGRREPIVGVVGALQFDVIVSRMKNEYNVQIAIDPAGYTCARWIGNPSAEAISPGGSNVLATDRQGRRLILFTAEWDLQYFASRNPDVQLLEEV
jgi:peptide chain release factor 3